MGNPGERGRSEIFEGKSTLFLKSYSFIGPQCAPVYSIAGGHLSGYATLITVLTAIGQGIPALPMYISKRIRYKTAVNSSGSMP